jgi:uncharacterized phage protein (TIGR01671 family)
MREIKFRVWNKGLKKFDPAGLPIEHNSEKGIFGIDDSYVEHFVVQQYTGLKDKNGVEIYEGDILGGWGVKSLYEIRWSEAYSGEQWCEFEIQNDDGAEVKSEEPSDYYGGVYCPEYKIVVGNIFEGVDK